MVKKFFKLLPILLCILFLGMTSKTFADPFAQLEQAKTYQKQRQYGQAERIYQQILTDHPGTDHAFEAQKMSIILYVAWNKQAQAETAFQQLIDNFSGHSGIAQAVHDIAYQHRLLHKYKKANQLDQHVIDNWPESDYALLAQMDLAKYYVDRGDAAAEAAVDKLLADFAGNPLIARAIHDVAQHYSLSGRYEKANEHYQYVIDHWPQTEYAELSRIDLAETNILSLIDSGDDTATEAALDNLIADFTDNPGLQESVFVIGEKYYNDAFRCEKEGKASEARENFQKALLTWEKIIEELPESIVTGWAYNFSADCYRRAGWYEKAIEYYQKVVDDWPDYEYAWDALFRIGRNYEALQKSGLMSKSEVNPVIKSVYEQVLDQYPDCKAAKYARRWLSRHNHR